VDGHIAHLNCRYRVIGPRDAAGAVADRLDRVAREQVAEALSDALDQALGDDPTVYVLRRVDCSLWLNLTEGLTDTHQARRWGARLAGATVRAIANANGDGTTLVRFADQADYVAHFAADLAQDRAWERWFYGPFAALQVQNTSDALRGVLLDHHDQLPAILSYLHQYGALEAVLAGLGPGALRSVWSSGLGAVGRVTPESIRPIFAQVSELVDRLGLWTATQPRRESLFLTYLGTGPPEVDWRDYRGLAVAALDILRFLLKGGHVRQPDVWLAPGQPEHRLAQDPPEGGQTAAFLDRLDQALVDFDWLDTSQLRAGILDLLRDVGDDRAQLPARPSGGGPTPRQRALLDALAALLREGRLRLDRGQPDSAENALRLYAALVARAPEWADDGLVPAVIRDLLAGWRGLARSASASEAARALRQGAVMAALETLPEGERGGAVGPFRSLARWGESGLSLVTLLSGGGLPQEGAPGMRVSSGESGDTAPEPVDDGGQTPLPGDLELGLETGCAGLFLLLRAVMDVQLPGLIQQVGYPPRDEPSRLSSILTALGLRWAGPAGLKGGHIDPGLGPLVGTAGSPALSGLRHVWSQTEAADHLRFQTALLRLLAGQRLVRGSTLHLYWVPFESDRFALVAGDQASSIWPLGRVVDDQAQVGEIVPDWSQIWTDATGYRPTVAVSEALYGMLPGNLDGAGTVVIAAADSVKADDEVVSAYQAGYETLSAALSALDAGRLELPDVDLTLALTAINLLRVWARWLRGFATSSAPYLLENFIRRSGWVSMDEAHIQVELENRPLDIIIDMAGYLATLEKVAWLGGRDVGFQLRGSL
jgi:hypothetical protein